MKAKCSNCSMLRSESAVMQIQVDDLQEDNERLRTQVAKLRELLSVAFAGRPVKSEPGTNPRIQTVDLNMWSDPGWEQIRRAAEKLASDTMLAETEPK